jgi:hypothetical protein
MKALRAFEASGTAHPVTRHHITEDLNLLNETVTYKLSSLDWLDKVAIIRTF